MLHTNSLDLQATSTEHTPIWKSVEPTMSTSPLASQHRQPAIENAHTLTIEPELLSLPTRSFTDSFPARDRDAEPIMPLLEQVRREQRSRSRSVALDGGDVPDCNSLEFDPLGEMRDHNPAKRQKRDPIRSKKKQQKTENGDIHDESSDVDEDFASWKPSRVSRAQNAPCHPRVTRRQGNSILVEGLKKPKRPRKRMEVDSGSATERLTLPKSKRDQVDSQPMDSVEPHTESSVFLIGLEKTDTALSESQRMKYEQVSVGTSSLECSRLPVDEARVSADDLVELVLKQPDEANTIVYPDSHGHRASQPSTTEIQALEKAQGCGTEDSKNGEVIEIEEKPNDQKDKEMASSFQDHQPSTVMSTVLGTQAIAGESGRSKLLAADDESQADRGPKRSQMKPAKPGPRRAKGRKRKAAVTSRLDEADDDAASAEAMTREVGLPPELYKPRPTRSRAKRDMNSAGDDGGVKTRSSKKTTAIDTSEVEASDYVAEPDNTSKRRTRRPTTRPTKEHGTLVPTEAGLSLTEDNDDKIGHTLSGFATPDVKTRKGRISEARKEAGLDAEKQTVENDGNREKADDDLPTCPSRIRPFSRKSKLEDDIPMTGKTVDVVTALLSPTKTPSPKHHKDNGGQDQEDDDDIDDDEARAVSPLSTNDGRTKSIRKIHTPPCRGDHEQDQDVHLDGDEKKKKKKKQQPEMNRAVVTPSSLSPRPAYRVGLSRNAKIQPLLSCVLKR